MIAVCDFVEIKVIGIMDDYDIIRRKGTLIVRPDDVLYITRSQGVRQYVVNLRNGSKFVVTKRQLNKLLGDRNVPLDNPFHKDFHPETVVL